jgi:hypothetical protein
MTPVRRRVMTPLLLQYANQFIINDEQADEQAHELRDQVERLVWFQAKLPVWNEMVRKYE